MANYMKKAGSAVPSANRITLLRDADGDGVAGGARGVPRGAEFAVRHGAGRQRLLRRQHRRGGALPVSERADAHQRARARSSSTCRPGPRNHHWTKNLIANRDGTKLYVTTGSNSNVAEHGMDEEAGRAAIWEVDRKSGGHRIFATGLRNPNGLGLGAEERRPVDGGERARRARQRSRARLPHLGARTAASTAGLTAISAQNVDKRLKPPRPDLVAKAIKPDYALGNHVAPLGLVFSENATLPFGEGAFVGQHGSWNRRPPSGYNVVFIPFRDGKPSGTPVEVLSRLPQPRRRSLRPAGRRGDRQARRAARRRRRRQRDLAR